MFFPMFISSLTPLSSCAILTDTIFSRIVSLEANYFMGPDGYLEPMKDAYAKIVKEHPAQAVIVDVSILLSALVIE